MVDNAGTFYITSRANTYTYNMNDFLMLIHISTQRPHKRLVNVSTNTTFTIAFIIGSECPFIERLVLVKTFS